MTMDVNGSCAMVHNVCHQRKARLVRVFSDSDLRLLLWYTLLLNSVLSSFFLPSLSTRTQLNHTAHKQRKLRLGRVFRDTSSSQFPLCYVKASCRTPCFSDNYCVGGSLRIYLQGPLQGPVSGIH
jgi:hypothetical protein